MRALGKDIFRCGVVSHRLGDRMFPVPLRDYELRTKLMHILLVQNHGGSKYETEK